MLIPLVVGQMGTNAYIFSEDDKTAYIIDPGGDKDLILEKLEKNNLQPRGILCTHGHLDHTSEVGPLMSAFESENLFLGIHEKDAPYLGDSAEEMHRRSFASLGILDNTFFSMIFNASPPADLIFRDGGEIRGTGLTVLHTPGHTEGSVSFYHAEMGILFSGDTLFSRGIGRTDLPGGDMEAIIQSIKESLFTLPEDTKVFPGHGPETDIGSEKRSNPFIR